MSKKEDISYIKRIIADYGSFSVGDLEGENSPIVNSLGKDNFQLAERFSLDDVTVITYVHETEVDQNDVDYEDLPEDTISEIVRLAEDYEADQIRTQKRIS